MQFAAVFLFVASITALFSSLTITGTVFDKASQPVSNVSVSLASSNLKTSTGTNGEFTISLEDSISSLQAIRDTLTVTRDEITFYKTVIPHTDTTLLIHINDIPEYFTRRIDSIPDYFQRDRSFGGFPKKGAYYCGPVAISNSLLYLTRNGYNRIFTLSGNLYKDQHELISQLGSRKYINTGSKGSSPANICTGVHKYLRDQGYHRAKLRYYGFRDIPSQFRTDTLVPDMDLARESTFGNRAVWLNIGWYSYNRGKKEYKRNGGHWVALAGYGHNGKKADPRYLIIHDSETRYTLNDYLRIDEIKDGTLKDDIKGGATMPQATCVFALARELSVLLTGW